jgi:hypothetical protein
MHEREAFRAIFSFGGTIESLRPDQVGGLEGAIKNARAFAGRSSSDAEEGTCSRGSYSMSGDRASVFSDDLDLSDFQPKPPAAAKQVREVAERAGLQAASRSTRPSLAPEPIRRETAALPDGSKCSVKPEGAAGGYGRVLCAGRSGGDCSG